jgi:hypothetical protein
VIKMQTNDARVAQARTFLREMGSRLSCDQLPYTVVMRGLLDARRHLARVLEYLDSWQPGHPPLSPADVEVIVQGLEIAAYYANRGERPDQAVSFRALARRIRGG